MVTDQKAQVFGYYALAAGAVAREMATRNVRRNMPEPVPVMVLARLAVDIRALLVHALNEQAQQFYRHYGFQESPQHPMTLMLRLG
ncbi:hypothetical protein AGMMS49545_09170 [Betaproteobacteria bacterium]|nr:hypothetical protein AGMMS49545_09170 [Betaproteobacteria bacterium]GHU48006.1 hypothetical protein AGMMS50289_24030 [Betaproteobacteria bacterium]